ELDQSLPRPIGVREAEGGEPFLRRIGCKAVAARRQIAGARDLVSLAAGEGFEQRSEEQPLVDCASCSLMVGEDRVETLRWCFLSPPAEAEHPCEPIPCVPVGGHGVDLCLLHELEPVLD